MADEVEHVLAVLKEALVYKLPPRQSTQSGYRAADWGLDKPLWKGRLLMKSRGDTLTVTLQDTSSGQTFAEAPITGNPSDWVEAVVDSSRYFVLKIANQGKHAYIGMGFQERGDAFDFNVALQDFHKRDTAKKEAKSKEDKPYVPKHDFSLKAGQTITVKIKKKKKEEEEEEEEEGGGGGGGGARKNVGGGGPPASFGSGLRPPPGGLFASSSSSSSSSTTTAAATAAAAANPFAPPQPASANPFAANSAPFATTAAPPTTTSSSSDPFGAFQSGGGGGGGDDPFGTFQSSGSSGGGEGTKTSAKGADWVTF